MAIPEHPALFLREFDLINMNVLVCWSGEMGPWGHVDIDSLLFIACTFFCPLISIFGIDWKLLHCFRYQFVPQMIFLNSLFGYLSLLIIVKWCTGSQADLYHVMIYMFLSPTDDLDDNQLFFGQKFFQVLSLL